jgi:hypothetical protein
MLLYFDSFDHYDEGRLTEKWNTKFGLNPPYGGGPIVTTAAARSGRGLQLSAGAQCTKSLPDIQTFIVGFAMKVEEYLTDRRICYVRDEATIQLYLDLSGATGKIYVKRGDGSVLGISSRSIAAGKWNYYQFKGTISHTVGAFEFRINRATEVASTIPIDTQMSSDQRINNFGFGDGRIPLTAHKMNYDDLYICDTTGSVNNDFLGIQTADALYPRANGIRTEWATGGSGAIYTAVNEHLPDGDGSYRYRSDGTPLADIFFFDRVRETHGGIAGVAESVLARKLYGNECSYVPLTRPGTWDAASGTINYEGNRLYIETDYAFHQSIWESNPGAGTWTAKAINRSQFGVF